MTVSNEDRDQTWQLDQDALERVLHDIDRIRTAFAQDYVNRRIEIRHDGDFTDAQIEKFRHNGGVVWDANYGTLAQLLKHRSSLVSHGWGPRPTVRRSDLLGWDVDAITERLRALGIEVTDDMAVTDGD